MQAGPFETMHRALQQQGELLMQVTRNELPALRLELAFLRADLQALDERLAGRWPAGEPAQPAAWLALEGSDDSGWGSGGHSAAGTHGVVGTAAAAVHSALAAAANGVYGIASLGYSLFDGAKPDEALSRPPRIMPVGFMPEDFEFQPIGQDPRRDEVPPVPEELDLQPSIWDCANIVALHGPTVASQLIGGFNVILTFLLLVLNIAVQYCFVIAVYSMVGLDPARTNNAMRNRRLVEGHDIKNMDYENLMTKTLQYCRLGTYDLLTDTIGSLIEYLNKEGHPWVMNGSTICFMAMMIWILDVMKELRAAADFSMAVIRLPNAPNGAHLARSANGEGHVVVAAARINKVASILLVTVPRLAIAVALLLMGLRFLAQTFDTSELILNAVALEVVNNVDEMLFQAIAPRLLLSYVAAARIRYSSGLPLGAGRRRSIVEMPAQTAYVLVRLGAMLGLLGVAYFHNLLPAWAGALAEYATVCEYDTNFTYTVHPMTALPIFAHVDPYGEGSSSMNDLKCFYAARQELLTIRAGFPPSYGERNQTLEQLVNGSHPLCQAVGLQPTPLECPERREGLRYFSDMRVGEDFYRRYDCRDQDVAFMVLRQTCLHPTFRALGGTDFFEEVRSCRDLVGYCGMMQMANVSFVWSLQLEKVCPQSCGKCQKDPED